MSKLWATFCPLDEKPRDGRLWNQPGCSIWNDFLHRCSDPQEGRLHLGQTKTRTCLRPFSKELFEKIWSLRLVWRSWVFLDFRISFFLEHGKVTTRHSPASCSPPPETIKFNDESDNARVRTFRLSEKKVRWRQNTITVLHKILNIQNSKKKPANRARANLTLLRTLLTNFLISSTVH